MRVYTHGVIAYLLYAKHSVQAKTLAVIGGILPDFILAVGFVFHYAERFIGWSIFAELHNLFHHSWLHTVTEVMHSFVVVLVLLLAVYLFYEKAIPFFVGMLAHGVVDFLTHTSSTYNHFLPLPVGHFTGVVSYTSLWFTILEHILLVVFLVWVFFRKKEKMEKK